MKWACLLKVPACYPVTVLSNNNVFNLCKVISQMYRTKRINRVKFGLARQGWLNRNTGVFEDIYNTLFIVVVAVIVSRI